MQAVNYCVHNNNNVNLLAGKKVKEIEEYASGEIDMVPFMKMFRSLKKAVKEASNNVTGHFNEHLARTLDTTGLSWEPLPLIPQKLNSAISTISKIPIEPQCVAQDGLAMKKKKEDLEFLKNKPLIEEDLQDIADQMDLGKIDLGATRHSAKKFDAAPFGLDLSDPDEENIFSQLIYSLSVETAVEKCLQQFYLLKKANQVKLLEITDTFKFGVCAHSAYKSAITHLPSVEYVYPGNLSMPPSKLPDYSDTTHRIEDKIITALEMFEYFGGEIRDLDHLNEILNEKGNGYCSCNGLNAVTDKNVWGTFKVSLKCIEVRSIDWVGVRVGNNRKRAKTFTTNEREATHKIWAQNTYRFWWLVNTKYCFGIERLPFTHRTKGAESYQNFSTHIYRAQKKSAVELCIGENKKAQIADIKMEHSLIKSLPPGKYIDLRFLRSALEGLKKEDAKWTQQDLINLAFEHNIMIGDTEGFEGKNDGQMKPFIDIPGGLKQEVAGYITTILNADRNIASFTGINEQLTGQSANPEGLVGLQKLLINSSINAIYYANEAIQNQFQELFNVWGSLLQASVEEGGRVKQAIIDFIGLEDADLIDGLNETPLHNLTIKVLVGQREVERQMYMAQLNFLKEKGIISTADEYVLSGIDNPKERFAYLAVKEKRFMKKQEQIRQENYAQQQQLVEQQGQNMMNVTQAKVQGDKEKIYAQGEVNARVMELAATLGMTQKEAEHAFKLNLQRDRSASQKDKQIATVREKANIEQQEALQ